MPPNPMLVDTMNMTVMGTGSGVMHGWLEVAVARLRHCGLRHSCVPVHLCRGGTCCHE